MPHRKHIHDHKHIQRSMALDQEPTKPSKKTSSSYLGRIVKSVGTIAFAKTLGVGTALTARNNNFSLFSNYMPLSMQDFLNARDSSLFKFRNFIASKININEPNRLFEVSVLTPILEDSVRVLQHYAIKKIQNFVALKCFGKKEFADTKIGKIMRIGLVATLQAFAHFESGLCVPPNHITSDPRYLSDRNHRELINQYASQCKIAKDSNVLLWLVSALGYSVLYERNHSLIEVMLCHSLSNLFAATVLENKT